MLRVQGRGKHATLLRRPVQRLYPLEVAGDTQDKKLANEPLNSKTLSGDDDQEVSNEDNSSTGLRIDTDPQEISVDTSCPQRVKSNRNSDNENEKKFLIFQLSFYTLTHVNLLTNNNKIFFLLYC